MIIPAYNKRGCVAFYSRRESITGESPTSFPEENTTMPYSGFEPEPTRLQVEGHIHHTDRWRGYSLCGTKVASEPTEYPLPGRHTEAFGSLNQVNCSKLKLL
ncbi:hypothetical protein TNCV_2915771 [Trichonephila clavipes]|nr:hypothetical protein TNCV_2915771 [Trichonephila clavipes]